MKSPHLLVGVLCLLLTGIAFSQQPERKHFGKNHPFTEAELPAGPLKEKLQNLPPQARGKAMKWLHEVSFADFDAAKHMRVDNDGGIYMTCPITGCQGCGGDHHHHDHEHEGAAPLADSESAGGKAEDLDQEPEVAGTSLPISSPPVYNSKPGAPFHIYIDFNGAVVQGKQWNSSYSVTRWECLPWSLDGDRTTFSVNEQAAIRRIWERVAEDYAPFNVNVTTDVTYDPDNYTGDKNKVGWLLITPTKDKSNVSLPHDGYGGVAYLNVFGRTDFFSRFQPAFVTDMSSMANVAEAASHEMGHNMGLSHDGLTTGAEYYGGHVATANAPSWGPIMGTGYNRNVSQWSKGGYLNGNQTQDDLAIIAGKITYRTDDHGSTFGTATAWLESPVNQPGVIEKTNVSDFFTFNTGAGTISFNANTYRCDTETWGGNLDILLELYDESQTLIASHNPPADVNASISTSVPAGRYYLVVRPTGAGSPMSSPRSGYTVYGSVGQYTITGNFNPQDGIFISSPGGGETWFVGVPYDITWGSGLDGNVKIELFKGDSLHTTIAASTPNNGSYQWNIPYDFTQSNDYRMRITSIEDPTISDESVSDFTITTDLLAEALDTTGLIWATSGNLPWFYQTTTTYDGVDAAQSGAITHNETSSMQTTLVGPGTMTFWWKVSSEADYDFLRFFINDVEQTGSLARISGNVDWTQKTVDIPPGTNTVRWSYTKDDTIDGGADAGWVDQVVFIPPNAPLIAVEQPAGTGLSTWSSTVNFGSVDVDSSSPRTFTIRNNGTANLTGLALTKSGTHSADYTLGSLSTTTLAPGESTTFTVTFEPGTVGTRTAALQIASNDTLRNPFHINLTGNGLGPGTLVVTGTDDLTSSGNIGGPFSPTSIQYTLSNPGGTSINWTASKSASWVTLSPSSGELTSNASTTVTVSINSNANGLSAGIFNDTVNFDNSTYGTGNTTRAVALSVNTPPVVNAGPDQIVFYSGTFWSPLEIAPAIWLDASDTATLTLNGGTVSQWADKSGNANHLTQGTSSLQPATGSVINGVNGLRFNGKRMATSSNPFGATINDAFVMAIYRVDSVANGSLFSLTGSTTAANRWQAYAPWGDGNVYFDTGGASSTNRVISNYGVSPGSIVLGGFYGSKTDNVQQIYKNGTLLVGDSSGHTANTVGNVIIGSDGSESQNMTLGEAVVINSTVSLEERQNLEGYMAHKWGLAVNLPENHPHKSASPINESVITTLEGSASDADEDTLVTTWSVVSGPGQVVFDDTGDLNTTASFAAVGVYTLRLTADDGFTQVSDDVIITVEPTPTGLIVRYNGNGSTGGTVPSDGANYDENATVTVLGNSGSLVRAGYTFAGWNTSANGSGTAYQPGNTFNITANVNLYAQWTANTYNLTFNANGGTTPSPTGKSVTFDSAYGPLATTSRNGYTFSGWFTAESEGTEVTDATIVATASDHTLFAQWTPNTYTVTFNANGGDTPSPTSKTVAFDSTYGTLATVTRIGYTFTGWFTSASDGSLVTDSTTVTATADHTLYAQWTPTVYTVSYDANNATSGTAPSSQTKVFGENLTLATNTGNLDRTGYTFDGWNTAADGSGTNYNEGGVYSANADAVLHARWIPNTYTVTFNANGGEAPVPSSKLVTFGSPYDDLATTTRPEYYFKGWFDAPDGGNLVTSVTSVTTAADHTLYAQWSELFLEMNVTRNSTTIAAGGFDSLGGSAVGNSSELIYNIANGGTDTLILDGVVISNLDNCTVDIDSQPASPIQPFSVDSLVLTATPTAEGSWSFTVSIGNNTSDKNPYQWTAHGVTTSPRSVILTPVADTWINAHATGNNYGSRVTFTTSDRQNSSNDMRGVGLLKFDLTRIPSNATITSASLGLVQSNENFGSVNIVNITNSWTEGGATWANTNNRVGDISYGSQSAPGLQNSNVPDIVLNDTGLDVVRNWLTTPSSNHGLGVKAPKSINNAIDLHSREAVNPAHRPKLTIDYIAEDEVAAMYVSRASSFVAGNGTDSVSGTVAGAASQLTYTIANIGSVNLTLTTPVSVTGASNCTVQVNSQPAKTITPSATTNLVLTVTPTGSGLWSANVSIANNDPRKNPYNWVISGTASGELIVAYHPNNATSGTAPAGQNKIPGVDLTLATNTGNLARDGYDFAGWNSAADGTGTSYPEGGIYNIDASITLYARWTTDSYTTWSHDNFNGSGQNDLPDADPDGDGLTNLQEFAFGTDPRGGRPGQILFVPDGQVTRPGVPAIANDADAQGNPPFRAVFGRRKNHVAAGLTYTVEFSADLAIWTANGDTPVVLSGEDVANTSEIEAVGVDFPATVPTTSSGNRPPQFFRVGVSME